MNYRTNRRCCSLESILALTTTQRAVCNFQLRRCNGCHRGHSVGGVVVVEVDGGVEVDGDHGVAAFGRYVLVGHAGFVSFWCRFSWRF
jgi:hypothetical protein